MAGGRGKIRVTRATQKEVNPIILRTEVNEASQTGTRNVCAFHTGRVVNKHFSCCQQHVSKTGCTLKESHVFPSPSAVPFQRYWHYHPTPSPLVRELATSQPPANVTRAHREFLARARPVPAIALDCEMGTAASGDSELIRLTAINYFTREVLVDQLVQPSVPMKEFRTRFSGITAASMRLAVKQRTCIFGRDAARNRLWEFVGPETVVVVHGGNNDFSALRWIHPLVIDTFILDGYGAKTEGGRSLKNLCSRIINISIQEGKGHDSFEDAAACRELAHRWVLSIPD